MTEETKKTGEAPQAASEKAPEVNGAQAPLSILLRKPVIANGEEVKELRFREPTAGDIDQIGNPVLIDMFGGETPKISFDTKSMTKMMAALAAVPPSTIKQMHPRDWNTAAWTLASFFIPDL